MPQNIKMLSNHTINQMAAGEVVERPAHLVKELIENSLDAKATNIEVLIDDGGRFVQVIDNGTGIRKEDLALAFTPHATSKISNIEDLWKLYSFGFRGEALASISAISDCSLSSFFQGQDKAYSICSDFGKVSEVKIAGSQVGTTVVIKDLFKNLPARLKFLKSPSAELIQIKSMFKALALSYPHVSFKLKTKKDLIFLFPEQKNAIDRVKDILDLKNLYEVKYKDEEFQVQAWYGSPENTQKTRKQIWIFVQDRWVQDKALQKAIIDSYRQFLMHGEYPMLVLKLSCKPEDIDINIHPSKAEVKFQNPSGAYRAVLKALRPSIERAPWLQNLLSNKGLSLNKEVSLESNTPVFNSNLSVSKNTENTSSVHNFSFKDEGFATTQYQSLPKQNIVSDYSNSYKSSSSEEEKWAHLQVLAQVDATYIVTQSSQAVIFVDQHAAHERILFERLYQGWKKSKIVSQNLLIPIELNLSIERAQLLFSYKKDLERLGIFLEKKDKKLFLTALPEFIKESSVLESFAAMLDELESQSDSFVLEQKITHIFASMACHSAIRAGKIMNTEQMKNLLVQMDENQSSFCPHGRPVFVKYPFSKLEKDFGRIV